MSEETLAQLVAALFEMQWTAAIAAVVPLGLWLYRKRKDLAEIDTWDEVKVIALPVVALAAAGIAAGVDPQTLVLASLTKLLVGIGWNSKPVLPAGDA